MYLRVELKGDSDWEEGEMLRPSLRSVLKSVLFLHRLDEGEEDGGVLVLEGLLLLSMEEEEDDDDWVWGASICSNVPISSNEWNWSRLKRKAATLGSLYMHTTEATLKQKRKKERERVISKKQSQVRHSAHSLWFWFAMRVGDMSTRPKLHGLQFITFFEVLVGWNLQNLFILISS